MKRLTTPAILACALAGIVIAPASGAGTPTAGLAFVKSSSSSSSVWVAAANGRAQRRLGPGFAPVLSPDGRLVAAADQPLGTHTPPLILYRVVGGRTSRFPGLGSAPVTPLAFSPDSRYLAAAVEDISGGAGQGNAALVVLDTTSGTTVLEVPGIVSGASWQPGSGHTVAFGLAHSQRSAASADLYSATLGSGHAAVGPLTTDGRSIYPVWGARGIVFDRFRLRRNAGAVYQLMLRHPNGTTTQITHTRPALPVDGLQPIAISAGGRRLLAEYVGTDTGQAYAVDLATHQVRKLAVGTQMTSGFGISRDGRRVLVGYGGFFAPSGHARVATLPFSGGRPTVLVRGGDDPSWNR